MKKSKSYIILLIAVMLLGISLFLIGGVMVGWDVLGWFSTPMACFIYLAVLIFAMILLYVWYKMKD